MATLLTKALIVAGGLAGASATGGGIYYLTSKQETTNNKQSKNNQPPITKKEVVKDKIINNLLDSKKVLLTKGLSDNDKWTAPWTEFKKAHKNGEPQLPWKFTAWKTDQTDNSNLESFKTQCVDLGKQKVSGTDDKVFVEVDKYCTTAKDVGNA